MICESQAQELANCQTRPDAKPGMAAVQPLNTKVYISWSPSIIQTCMRSRFMSVNNGMAIGLAMSLFGMYVSEEQIKDIWCDIYVCHFPVEDHLQFMLMKLSQVLKPKLLCNA